VRAGVCLRMCACVHVCSVTACKQVMPALLSRCALGFEMEGAQGACAKHDASHSLTRAHAPRGVLVLAGSWACMQVELRLHVRCAAHMLPNAHACAAAHMLPNAYACASACCPLQSLGGLSGGIPFMNWQDASYNAYDTYGPYDYDAEYDDDNGQGTGNPKVEDWV